MANVYISRGATTLGSVSNGDAVFLLGGSASVTSGLDLSGIASITLLSVGDDFNGQIGTAANPLKANVGTKINYGASGGDLYFQSQGSGSSVSTLLYVFGGGHFHFLTGGTLTRADVANGKMTISSACTATSLRISGGSVHLFGTAGTAPTLLKNIGGYCLTERGATTLEHGGGVTRVQAGTNSISAIDVEAEGLELVECGTITQLNLYNGVPEMKRLTRRLTITNCNINMSLRGAGAFLDHEALTFTNAAVPIFAGGGLPPAL